MVIATTDLTRLWMKQAKERGCRHVLVCLDFDGSAFPAFVRIGEDPFARREVLEAKGTKVQDILSW